MNWLFLRCSKPWRLGAGECCSSNLQERVSQVPAKLHRLRAEQDERQTYLLLEQCEGLWSLWKFNPIKGWAFFWHFVARFYRSLPEKDCLVSIVHVVFVFARDPSSPPPCPKNRGEIHALHSKQDGQLIMTLSAHLVLLQQVENGATLGQPWHQG